MIEIRFEIGGKEVQPRMLAEALEAAVLSSVKGYITQRLSLATCPTHGAAPSVLCRGTSLKDLSLEISGCCDALIEEAKRALE